MTRSPAENPFPATDSHRHAIWEMLVRRDIEAFLSGDWSRVAADFEENGFFGTEGGATPDEWQVRFPTLASYRDSWLAQSARLRSLTFPDDNARDLLFRASLLRDIRLTGARAAAHKKFFGSATAADGTVYSLNWQTVYWLRREQSGWLITGFMGYLPYPAAAAAADFRERLTGTPPPLVIPPSASQHTTAGPYSPVVCVRPGGIAALSGQGPLAANGEVVGATIQEQTVAALENCRRLLAAAGASWNQVFKVNAYLRDMSDWEAFNSVYRRYFEPPYPARTTVQAVLWGGIRVEIDMLARID